MKLKESIGIDLGNLVDFEGKDLNFVTIANP